MDVIIGLHMFALPCLRVHCAGESALHIVYRNSGVSLQLKSKAKPFHYPTNIVIKGQICFFSRPTGAALVQLYEIHANSR